MTERWLAVSCAEPGQARPGSAQEPPTQFWLAEVAVGAVGPPWAGGETRKWWWCLSQHQPLPATTTTMDSSQPLAQSKQSKLCKYKLRNNKRTDSEDESVKVGPKKRGPKPRLRSAGMSRYRRKEANARERQRQGEINTSFDRLREKIPHPGPSNGKCEKLRKIDILRVSIMYIRLVRWLTVMKVLNKY